MAHIEQFVFAAELADKNLPKESGKLTSLPCNVSPSSVIQDREGAN
jgi:hypothetical protein